VLWEYYVKTAAPEDQFFSAVGGAGYVRPRGVGMDGLRCGVCMYGCTSMYPCVRQVC
jgi:hypothetical protein